MKIACGIQLLFETNKTGIGKMTEYILEGLSEYSENEIYLNYFKTRRKNELAADMEQYVHNRNTYINQCSWFYYFIYRRLKKFLPLPYCMFFRKKYDVIQFFNYSVPFGVKGKKAVYIYDMAYMAYPETIRKETLDMLYREVEKACIRADKIITISEFSKMEIKKYLKIDDKKVAVVPCGVDNKIFRADYEKEEIERVTKIYGISFPYFLYLGTLEPRKNIPRLIEAYFRLKSVKPSRLPKLVIAGKKGWNYENIFETVQRYYLEEDVIFTGYVKDEDVPYLLSGALCFVFPSLYEGFGMPPLEAMACGTPVISSKVASIPEVVGNAGILIDPNDSEALCKAMYEMVINEKKRKKLQEKGLERSRKFSWKASAEKLCSVYQEMLGDGK